MRLSKANIAGLTSPRQQSEMKSILAGTWPPLRPLPIFKYETVEYRATIDFDKKRGEWVCRKTSVASNKVQELRGGLREITMALPHGEGEMFTEGEEPQEQELELEKDTNRRLQAIHEWRENYENGTRYFELRDYLSESQRTEIDDSLRLSLTARQLQFNSKNVAYVFDALSIAGGRFASLIEFAKRNKAKHETAAQSQEPGAVPETEPAINHDEQPPGVSSREYGRVLGDINPSVRDQGVAERCTDADEFPPVSIKDVFPEQEQGPLAKRMAHAASQQFEIETSETWDSDSAPRQFEIETSETGDADSPSLAEDPHLEESRAAAFAGFAAQARRDQSFVKHFEGADRIEGSASRFPALKISAFQVNVFAILFLFAVTSFTVGLTVGRGPLGKRLRDAPKSLLATEAKPPTIPDEADESTSRTATVSGTPTAPVASSEDAAGTTKLDDATPPEEKAKEKSEEDTGGSENSAEVRSMDSDSSPTIESKPSAKLEVNPEHSGAMSPMVRSMSPLVSPKVAHSRKGGGPIRSASRRRTPYRLASTIDTAPHLPRPSTVLVSVPSGGSQPFRVDFPTKTIGATSSLAMTSQLSVAVPPEPGPAVAHKSARLKAGELVSFVWPRYPGFYPGGDRYGSAETIRVRATIGQLGQVEEVKFLSGSLSLLPGTREAIRQWQFRPTLLDKRPVQAQQDVTIEFRPERYSSQLSAQHPSHN